MSDRFDTKKRDERGAAKIGQAPEKTTAIIVIETEGITSRDQKTKGVTMTEDEIEKGNEKETTTTTIETETETDIVIGIVIETEIEIATEIETETVIETMIEIVIEIVIVIIGITNIDV